LQNLEFLRNEIGLRTNPKLAHHNWPIKGTRQMPDEELDALLDKGQVLLDIHRPLLYQAQFRGHSQSNN
jgi:hypothetical protein